MRLAQARLLSGLVRSGRPFCFLRIGDMKLAYLLAEQHKRLDEIEFGVCGTRGLPLEGRISLFRFRLKSLARRLLE